MKKIFFYILLGLYFNLLTVFAIDITVAQKDYNNGIKPEGCIFKYSCERFMK